MAIETFATDGSSRITGMAYDSALKTLKIDYKRGGSYLYEEVPEEIFNALKTSPSIGKAIDSLVKAGGYSYHKIT